MATIDGQKTGGRQKGTPNKRLARLPDAQAIAERLNVNPLEILLRFAANDWQGLGYATRTRLILTKSGEAIEVDNIEPPERISAASRACEYLFPKRRSVEVTGAEGQDIFKSVTELVKEIADEAKKKLP